MTILHEASNAHIMRYEGIHGQPGAYWFVVDLPPIGGKRRQAKRRGFETKADAHEARLELLGQARRDEYVPPSRQTLAEYLDEWLATIESTIRPATHHSYARNVTLHIVPRIGAIRLQQIDAATLNRLFSALQAPGSNRSKPDRGLSDRTVRYIATILHRALKDAVRWGRLTRNPSDAADPPRNVAATSRSELRTWTSTELASFLRLSAGESDRLHPAWNFLALTGCRRGEALGLRWADVDLQTATASIRQTLIVVNHKPLFGTPKTGAGTRVIDLDKPTITSLRSLRKRQLEETARYRRRVARPRPGFHARRRTAPTSRAFLSGVHSPYRAVRPARYPFARPSPHLGNPRSEVRHSSEGGPGTPRPRDHQRHLGHLLPRDSGYAARGCRDGRRDDQWARVTNL